MLKNKKANIIFEFGDGVTNLILWIVGIVLVMVLLKSVSTIFNASSLLPSAKSVVSNGYSTLATIFNIIVLPIYIAFIVLSVKLIQNNQESKFIIALWFFLMIGYIGALLMLPSNILEHLQTTSSTVATVLTDMPVFTYMIENSLFFGILYFIITGIAMFRREDIQSV